MKKGALSGIRVLDLSRLLPGPYCSMMLADLGAEVIKIEEPGRGDYARDFAPKINRESVYFVPVNRNKKSLTLNLKNNQGKELFLKLVEKSDVVLESFRPGVMDKLGIGYETLKTVNEKVIFCSLSGYGQDGPYAKKAGHDVNYLSIPQNRHWFTEAGILSSQEYFERTEDSCSVYSFLLCSSLHDRHP